MINIYSRHYIKQNATKPSLNVIVRDENANIVNLSNIDEDSLKFHMREINDTTNIIINGTAAVIVDALSGKVRYDWAATIPAVGEVDEIPGDTVTIGKFYGEFEWTEDGAVRKYPDDGYIYIEILDDI